ncbi:hypothetical protein ACLOJK_003026 [Asimina triloba]
MGRWVYRIFLLTEKTPSPDRGNVVAAVLACRRCCYPLLKSRPPAMMTALHRWISSPRRLPPCLLKLPSPRRMGLPSRCRSVLPFVAALIAAVLRPASPSATCKASSSLPRSKSRQPSSLLKHTSSSQTSVNLFDLLRSASLPRPTTSLIRCCPAQICFPAQIYSDLPNTLLLCSAFLELE